jgi:hypothetical protein
MLPQSIMGGFKRYGERERETERENKPGGSCTLYDPASGSREDTEAEKEYIKQERGPRGFG